MNLPNLLVQHQCTAPSCSRMSSPLNILYLLPTIEELMANSTTRIPFVTMHLKKDAEQSCPFCRSPSRIIPVDPSFQNLDLRSASKVMFGSFFGHSGPNILEVQYTRWMPVQAPGNKTSIITQGTKIQWVIAGSQVHQLLIAVSSLTSTSQQMQFTEYGSNCVMLPPASTSSTYRQSTPHGLVPTLSSPQHFMNFDFTNQDNGSSSLMTSSQQPLQLHGRHNDDTFPMLSSSVFLFDEYPSQPTGSPKPETVSVPQTTTAYETAWIDVLARTEEHDIQDDRNSL